MTVIAEKPWAACLLLGAVVAVVYGPFVASPFIFDDIHSVSRNPYIRGLGNIPDFFTHPTTFSVHGGWNAYRPVLLTSYALSYVITGPDPWSFRIVNMLLHTANGLLVFVLLRRLLGGAAGTLPVLAGALLFTLHPGQTQAVMYISSRSELLAATFVLLALLRFLRIDHAGDARQGPWLSAWLPAIAAFAMALFTKATAVLFLPAALLLGLAGMPAVTVPRMRRLAVSLAPFVALYFAHAWLKRALLASAARSASLGLGNAGPAEVGSDLLLRVQAFGVYPRLALFPHPLNLFHELPEEGLGLGVGVALSAVLMLAFLGGVIMAASKGRRLLALGLAWFPAMLVPYLLVELNMRVNEHRLYPALVGLAIISADVLRRTTVRRRQATAAFGMLIILYAAGTSARNGQWMDSERFWLREVAAAPSLAWPYQNLAAFYDRQGRTREALDAYEQAQTRKGANLGVIHNYRGLRHVRAGHMETARDEFLQAVMHDPGSPDYLNNLGSVLDDLGQRREAERYLRRAIALTPCFARAHFNLGVVLERLERAAEAERAFTTAAACDDFYGRAHAKLGRILLDRNEDAKALRHLERAAGLRGTTGETFYDLARARARAGQRYGVLAALERAFSLGSSRSMDARTDPDFATVREAPHFRRLVGESPRAPERPINE